MGAQDLFDRSPNYQQEAVIDSLLADLRGKGFAGNVVKDSYRLMSPPEVATWTGERFQLALLQSGREVWLELRGFSAAGRTPIKQVRERADFASAICDFAQREGT